MVSLERRDRILPYVVPSLLLAIAAVQIYNEHVNDLNPWKGGGFGMFSTVDEPGRRIVRSYLIGEEGQEAPLRIPTSLQRLTWEVRSFPTPDRVTRLARGVADDLNQTLTKSGTFVRARHVRIEVLRTSYDTATREFRAERIAEATVDR